jgi:predicted lipid carrier protein YhbT
MNIVSKPFNGLLLQSPFALIPKNISNKIIVMVFNQIFAQSIKDGDLDFLKGNWVLIEVTDISLSFSLGLKSGQLIHNQNRQVTSLRISAKTCDFLDMVCRKKDPDTLFFQRKIKMQGSTELGLYVKNFLDAFDVESHWASFRADQALQNSYPLLKNLFCNNH